MALVAFTTDGDVFGGFYTVAVEQQGELFFEPNLFVFSFESHGRCETLQRFALKKMPKKKAHVIFWKNNSSGQFSGFMAVRAGSTLGTTCRTRSAPKCLIALLELRT